MSTGTLNATARRFAQIYTDELSRAHNQPDVSKYFAVSAPKETALRAALMESTEFLSMIYCADVDQLTGQVVSTSQSGLYTGRKEGARFRRKVGVEGNEYQLTRTDSGSFIDYDTLSVWANAGDESEFAKLLQAFSTDSFALDMLRIGFNGTKAEKNTDAEKYPNGEDVNTGWHEIARKYKDGNQIVTTPTVLDKDGHYKSLDAMASDLVNSKIPAQFRNDPRLVVLAGADLVAAEQHRLYNAAATPTEKIAAQLLGSTIAGKTAYIPPFFPGKRMVVTTLKNLHIYTQRNTRQRKAGFDDERMQYENSYLRNEGYGIEVPEMYAGFDEKFVTIGTVTEPKDPPAGG